MVHAFWDPPYVTPANPRAGETLSVKVHMGVCDVIANREGFPKISHDGNAVRIIVYGQHWDPGELCYFPTGTGTYSVGSYAPGNYTVTSIF